MKKSEEYFNSIERAKNKGDHIFAEWLALVGKRLEREEAAEEQKERNEEEKEILFDCS